MTGPASVVHRTDAASTRLRVQVSGWNANEGDVLEAVATFKVTAGSFTDVSTARSGPVVVTVK